MSEQNKDAERAEFEAYMLGREHPVFGWIDGHWFGRGDDPATYANDYVQGCWVMWQARSLPVGVPDEVLVELLHTAKKHLELHAQEASHPGQYKLINRIDAALNATPAAPTVKAEQADDTVEFGFDDRSVRVSQEAYAIFLDRESALRQAIQSLQDQLQEMQAQAPSLPAAGSAVEEVEQARFIEWATREYQVEPDEDLNLKHNDVIENRKGWMARAALSAQQSAPAYGSYTTRPAESVAGIALRQLGDESRWVEIRDLNAHAFPGIGPHDYYPVGTVLRMPAEQQSAPERVGVPVDLEFVRFLLGETEIEGVAFGEKHPDAPGQFWWRTHLRALLSHGRGEA